MNRADYMAALRRALSVLPEEERANALRYYEEYFDDAGPENEAKAIEELGEPAKVAAQIRTDRCTACTADKREAPLARYQSAAADCAGAARHPDRIAARIRRRCNRVWRASGDRCDRARGDFRCTAHSVRHSACGGAVIALLSCTLWATPANALVTLGNGLAAFAAGILLGLLSIKLSILFVPPVFRAFVAVLRAPFNWIRNRCRRTGGGNV